MKTLKLQQVTRYFGYILLCAVLFTSCVCGESKNNEALQNNADLTDMKVVVIDSCEYIQYHTFNYEAITHKGNCKYCVEREKRSLK
jgi:hypothetical protein